MLGRDMLYNCTEWKSLPLCAKYFYIKLKAKYNGSNNGNIRLYYSELKGEKGLSSHSTISRAIKELENNGWIERTKLGGLYRHFNEFRLTEKFDNHISHS